MKARCRSGGAGAHRLHHGVMQRRHGRVGPAGGGGLGHPGGVFEHLAECRDKGRQAGSALRAASVSGAAVMAAMLTDPALGKRLFSLADQGV